MPYNNIKELPDSVRNVLPTHAQEIYMSSFNSAYKEYKDKSKMRSSSDKRDQVAHKVAWSAVKKKYKKGSDEKWHER